MGRVARVIKVLQRQAIDLTQGAASSNFRLAGPEQKYDDYRLCALGLVSEYLLPDLATALQERRALRRRKLPLDNSKDNLLAVKEMDLSRKRPSKKALLRTIQRRP